MKNKQGLQGARRLLLCQSSLTIIIALTLGVALDKQAAISAISGGFVCILPNAYFAWIVFRHQGAKAAKKIANSFYKGEAGKIFLTLILFALIFIFIHINPIIFFVTYILVQMVYWFAPLIFDNKQNRPESD